MTPTGENTLAAQPDRLLPTLDSGDHLHPSVRRDRLTGQTERLRLFASVRRSARTRALTFGAAGILLDPAPLSRTVRRS